MYCHLWNAGSYCGQQRPKLHLAKLKNGGSVTSLVGWPLFLNGHVLHSLISFSADTVFLLYLAVCCKTSGDLPHTDALNCQNFAYPRGSKFCTHIGLLNCQSCSYSRGSKILHVYFEVFSCYTNLP